MIQLDNAVLKGDTYMVKTTQLNEAKDKQVKTIPIMISLLIGGFMGMFSETALNMAMNDLIIEFQISASTAQWLTTGYLLVLGILIPVSALLIKRFSTRKLFIVSISFSIVGLFIAAVSPSFSVLLIGRMIQAVGTGIILPLLFNTVLILFPPRKRGTAMGVVGLVMMFAPATGPIVMGLMIDNFNWHVIFWLIIPFLVFALIFGIIFIHSLSTITKHKIDILSIILSTIGFGGIVFGFSYAGEESGGWASPVVLFALVMGICSMTFFVYRQLSIKEPMLYLQVFKYPMFALGIAVTLFANIIIFSANILLPLYMRGGLGLSGSAAGLLLLPGGIVNGIMSLVNGRIFDKFGPRWLVIGGFIISILSTLFFSNISSSTNSLMIIVFFMLLMVSMSMVTTPSQTNGLNQLERELHPDGSAVVNSMIQTSGAIGTAIAVSILNASQSSYLGKVANPASSKIQAEALIVGIQNAFTFAALISIIGLICALFIKRVSVE